MSKNRIAKRTNPKTPAVAGKSREEKVSEAYEYLGVSELDSKHVPQITHILKAVPGGVGKCIEFLRGSETEEAKKWLDVYDGLRRTDQKLLPFEAICLAAGIPTKRMLEVIVGECFEQSEIESKIISRASKPVLIKAAVESGKGAFGHADRKMVLQAEQYAPVPKSQVVNFQAPVGQIGNNQVNNDNRSISLGEVIGFNRTLNKMSDRMSERMGIPDEPKQITEGKRSDSSFSETDTEEDLLSGEDGDGSNNTGDPVVSSGDGNPGGDNPDNEGVDFGWKLNL